MYKHSDSADISLMVREIVGAGVIQMRQRGIKTPYVPHGTSAVLKHFRNFFQYKEGLSLVTLLWLFIYFHLFYLSVYLLIFDIRVALCIVTELVIFFSFLEDRDCELILQS